MKRHSKERPDITHSLVAANDRIIKLHATKVVRDHGRQGYIPMPKELIGKYVTVTFEEAPAK